MVGGREGFPGEGEEHLVEGGASQADVVERDAAVVDQLDDRRELVRAEPERP